MTPHGDDHGHGAHDHHGGHGAHEHPSHGHRHHAHERPRDHGHAHHGHGAPDRSELPRGAGAGRTLFFDAPSGLAGDMIIASLVDMGVPRAVVEEGVSRLGLSGYALEHSSRTRSGIVAAHFDVHVEAGQPQRDYARVCEVLERSTLPERPRALASAIFARLAQSEARVHRMPVESVHFHEVGAVDALVDVVGAACAFAYLEPDEIVVSPLPMGRGFVRAAHGVLPLPAPAVVEVLQGFETYDAGIDGELVTPTGAAIVATLASRSARWPTMRPVAAGWGAGTRELADRPNLLRAVLGDRDLDVAGGGTHVVLEANVDDATGELVAVVLESMLAAGALDAWAVPATMKKGRPALVLSVLCRAVDESRLATELLRQSTSLGVRRHAVSRVERPRRVVEVETPFGAVRVKVSGGPFGPPVIKPELDDCRARAAESGVPLREVLQAALVAARVATPPP